MYGGIYCVYILQKRTLARRKVKRLQHISHMSDRIEIRLSLDTGQPASVCGNWTIPRTLWNGSSGRNTRRSRSEELFLPGYTIMCRNVTPYLVVIP